METKEILDGLNSIFRRVLKKEDIELNSETTAQDIDEWDSLTNMKLVHEMEKMFAVRFTFRDIVHLKNVGDICNAIQNKMK